MSESALGGWANHGGKVAGLSQALACPFCGEQPLIVPWHGGGPRKRNVFCANDTCLVQPGVCGTTENRALENWNYRPPRKRSVAA